MYVLLSPAKKLNVVEPPAGLGHSQPAHLGDTELLMETTRTLEAADLKRLMKISDKLAELNRQRFLDFETPFTVDNAGQAALMFAGDTYVGLDAGTLSTDDLTWAQNHVGILSGLYGLLRPLDLMQPYRLEMGTSLENPRGRNLVAFWRERITEEVGARVTGHADPTVVCCASNEYFAAVQASDLPGRVVTPVFKEIRDGKLKNISFFSKKARGMMARYAIQNRIERADDLKAFDSAGYAFREELSDETSWVFTRAS